MKGCGAVGDLELTVRWLERAIVKRVYYAYRLNDHYRKLFRMVGLMDYWRLAPMKRLYLRS